MNKIFFSSDTHFGHDKNFLYEPRGFSSIREHDEILIQNFNHIMDWSDEIYILGDIMLGDNNYGIKCLKQLPGIKHIIFGNHCTNTRIELYKTIPNVIVHGYSDVFKYGKYHFYLSHYPTITSNYDVDKPLERRVINLCGHSHTDNKFKDMDKGLIYHVELDAHHCYPVEIEQIIEEIENEYKKR